MFLHRLNSCHPCRVLEPTDAWWASSPVCLGEERLKLTRIGKKVPVGWLLWGCGVEVVPGIPVGHMKRTGRQLLSWNKLETYFPH